MEDFIGIIVITTTCWVCLGGPVWTGNILAAIFMKRDPNVRIFP